MSSSQEIVYLMLKFLDLCIHFVYEYYNFTLYHHELSDDTPRSGVVTATSQDGGGGQDVDGDKQRQISHGLAGAQRVGVEGTNQLTLTNRVSERSMAG